jgi:hypothetical protein
MSKRYGRKQKAAHRAEIAHLKGRLERESTEHMYLPHGDETDLESIAHVVEWREEEDGSHNGMVYRTAWVVVDGPADALLDIYYNQGVVQFKGRRYTVTKGNYTPPENIAGLQRVEIELVGIR